MTRGSTYLWPGGCGGVNKYKYILKTKVYSTGVIKQELNNEIDGLVTKISEWVMYTKEEGVRKALINLGWTPPPKEKED